MMSNSYVVSITLCIVHHFNIALDGDPQPIELTMGLSGRASDYRSKNTLIRWFGLLTCMVTIVYNPLHTVHGMITLYSQISVLQHARL